MYYFFTIMAVGGLRKEFYFPYKGRGVFVGNGVGVPVLGFGTYVIAYIYGYYSIVRYASTIRIAMVFGMGDYNVYMISTVLRQFTRVGTRF